MVIVNDIEKQRLFNTNRERRRGHMISPLYAANNMIRRAYSQGINLTNLKLQKLLYLLYTKYYHETNGSLFPDRFEAWQYGPVLTAVYEIFKEEGSSPLHSMRPDANGKMLIVSETGDFGVCFDQIWATYARKSAAYLVSLAHGDENPGHTTAWKKAVNAGGYGTFLKDEDIEQDGELWFGPGSNE
jgi:uncharacterized phage-associated protein